MTERNTGGPAFPSTLQYFPDDTSYHDHEGMTLRDYFAAKAMQGICVSKDEAGTLVNHGYEWIAGEAYRIADAMLKERETDMGNPFQPQRTHWEGCDEVHPECRKPRREWVGLEQSDMPDGEDPIYDDPRFIAGIVWAAKKLLEKNT